MASFSQPEPSDLPRERARHHAVALLLAVVLGSSHGFAQQPAGPFGAVAEKDLPTPPVGLAVVSSSGSRPAFVLSIPSPPELLAYVVTDSGTIVRQNSWKLQQRLTQLTSADLDRDGVSELIGLDEGDPAIVVLRRRAQGLQPARIPLDAPYERYLVADINNDGRMDLLLFGRNAAGMTVLGGRPGGSFNFPRSLFEDVSIVDAAVTDLNGDGIADVFLLNWLSNTLEVFFGIGNFVFSSQVTIALGAEPGAIALAPASRSRLVQLAITFADAPTVAIIRGNGAGEFSRKGTIPLPAAATGIQFASLNGDRLPDLVIALPTSMLTCLGRDDGSFAAPSSHGIRASAGLWTARDLDGNKKTDLLYISRSGDRVAVALDGGPAKNRLPPAAYVAGPEPSGIMIADVTRDGMPDLVVANRGGATVSVLVNRQGGEFEPHRQSAVDPAPGQLWAIAPSPGSWTTVLTGHPKSERISVARLKTDGFASGFFSIPTGPQPRILGASQAAPDTGMRILLQNQEPGGSTVTFSVFEQISGGTFIERSFRAASPEGRRWVSIADVGRLGDREVMVLLRTRDGDTSQVALARTGAGLVVSAVEPIVAFPDTGAAFRFLLTADINGDSWPDILVARSGNSPGLGIALSNPTARGPGSLRWLANVRISSPDQVLLVDADQDGNRDIVYFDAARRSVLAMYGRGGGELSPPKSVASVSSVGGLSVGPLRGSGMNDLAVTDTAHGYVRIVDDPF